MRQTGENRHLTDNTSDAPQGETDTSETIITVSTPMEKDELRRACFQHDVKSNFIPGY